MTPFNPIASDWSQMNFSNSEMKIDQLVNYFNEEKINLSPPFQRGHVWSVGIRKKLLKNMVQGRPIPAIFLYKEAIGSRYSYNILDGKQRLESLILFIGNQRQDLAINQWQKYFFRKKQRTSADFPIELSDGKKTFAQLEEAIVRDFREYTIPTIEISLSDDVSLDELISLFVDINQYGVAVKRFDIVKAMAKDPLLKEVFDLLAIKQKRGQDEVYKLKNNDFTAVLKAVQAIASLPAENARVDRMWERLLEIVLFFRTKKHRKPVEILKSFISSPGISSPRLSKPEARKLGSIFSFLRKAYGNSKLANTRLAADQTHFYTMITSLIGADLLQNFSHDDLVGKLVAFGQILDGIKKMPRDKNLSVSIQKYQEVSVRATTDVSRRQERQSKFIEIISAL